LILIAVLVDVLELMIERRRWDFKMTEIKEEDIERSYDADKYYLR